MMTTVFKKALAVSGGKDSLSMVDALQHEEGIIALIVDHRLRPESQEEAFRVSKCLEKRCIDYRILVWEHGENIIKDIQNKARKARYDLMTQWCVEHQVSTLVTAHHLEDQLETVFMRLAKGSGIKGLCGMRPKVIGPHGIIIERPFLQMRQQELHQHFRGGDYIDDPSNRNPQFERTRFRAFVAHYLDLDPELKILKSLEKINEIDAYFDKLVLHTENWWDQEFFLFERSVNHIFAKDRYPYKRSKIKQLYERLHHSRFKRTTFGHFDIIKSEDQVKLIKNE